MPTSLKTKQIKRTFDRDIARAVTDLNKILSQEEISKKFNIPKWKITPYKYKKKRKLRPLNEKTRKKILKFYNEVLASKDRANYRYSFRADRRKIRIGIGRYKSIKRIKPTISPTVFKVQNLIELVGIKELAKKMGVKPATVIRWKRGNFKRLRVKTLRNLHKLIQKLTKKISGIFIISKEIRVKDKIVKYKFILYEEGFHGSEERFLEWVHYRDVNIADVPDCLIARKGRFPEEKATAFLEENLPKISKNYLASSIENCRAFVRGNFKGKTLNKLRGIIRKHAKK